MRTLLGILLLTAALRAQVPAIPGIPRPSPGSGGTQAAGGPATAAGRGRGNAASPSAGGVPSPRDLRYPPLRALQSPSAASFTLPNGMKLYLLEDHDLPVVGGIALVRTGSLFDSAARIGLAELAGITLRTGGTTLKTGEQIDSVLDGLGASMESAMGDSLGTLSFTGPKENLSGTLQLFKEMLTQPGFRQDKLNIAKSRLRTAIAHRNDDPAAVTLREFARVLFGKDTPLAWQMEYATIERVSRNDLRAFHQRYFFPANVTLGIWGDFQTAEMKAQLETLFAGWTAQQPPVPEFAKAANTPASAIYLAEKKDATRSFMTVGRIGVPRSDKDYAALELLANILSHGAQSRIADRARSQSGLPNIVNDSSSAAYTQPGVFEVSVAVGTLSTIDGIKAIRGQIERTRNIEVTEDELRVAREGVLHHLIFTLDSKTKLFARQLMLEYYGYPKDYLAEYQKALQSVTRADLMRVAKQYLDPATLTVLVTANPTLFVEPLEKLGAVTRIDLTIPEAKSELAESSDASLTEGKQILLQAQAAAGGAAKLAAVRDYTMLAEYSIDPGVATVGGSKIVQTDKWVTPTTFRQDAMLPSGRAAVYTDGKVGWITTQQGWGALAGAQRNQVFGDLFRVYYRLLLSDRIEGRKVNAIDEFTVQISDATGMATTAEFDPKTHLLKRLSYDTQQPGGAPVYAEEIYEDFRDIAGIMLPFKVVVNQGGRPFSFVVMKDYKINTGLNPTELARRPQ